MMGRAQLAAGFVCEYVCMWIAVWPVQHDLFVCDWADHRVEFGPWMCGQGNVWLQFPPDDEAVQSCIISRASTLKMSRG